ncbi:pilus assembly PilX family protein [Arenimonas composti]|uniref:Type 4 fimbrial biogenesis protein PilX N-terminal domain-containing protein n=1 Tax=Arenimonas composti TR7-09 = DSM 18010 TaxID=1121013 RepID=A0A091BHW2_9GAMM|nr:PilX N-terminal domain-containing pilus assembly protein [Arenimonas composti]KFN51127.1 hypothetical protein P873_04310 [Arenimonas composti TR7-09 = DSM 18010]
MTESRYQRVSRQRGIALLVVLLLLLVMTLVGLAVMRGTQMEERMAAGLYDRSLAFQSAEAALREAEALIFTAPTFPGSGNCTNGLCPQRTNLADTDVEYWLMPATGWRNATVDTTVDNDGTGAGPAIATPTQFIIEPLGMGENWFKCGAVTPVDALCLSQRFRVTVRTNAPGRAEVLLQSTVSAP